MPQPYPTQRTVRRLITRALELEEIARHLQAVGHKPHDLTEAANLVGDYARKLRAQLEK
jgi:hypothetical protein